MSKHVLKGVFHHTIDKSSLNCIATYTPDPKTEISCLIFSKLLSISVNGQLIFAFLWPLIAIK